MAEKKLEHIAPIIYSKLDVHDARRAMVNARHKRIARKVQRIGMMKRVNTKAERFAPWVVPINATLDRVKSEILSEVNLSLDLRFKALTQMIDIFGDGVAYLFERLDAIDRRLDRMDAKFDSLSVEFLAHRLNPEAHNRSGGNRVIKDKRSHDEEKKPS